MFRRQFVKPALLALSALSLIGATDTPAGFEEEARTALRENRYGDAEQLFRRAAFDADCKLRSPRSVTYVNYLREWIDAGFIYPEELAASVQDAQRSAVDGAEARDALDEIVRRAASTRIVMLNEHHNFPRSRAFAEELARRLRPLGYDVLATETFSNNPDRAYTAKMLERLAKERYPRQGDGYYSSDPVYGRFLRTALALGYRPAAYETTAYGMSGTPEERANRREQDQADHLAEIMDRNPASKILVFVGFGHLYEAPMGSLRPMGLRLKEQTGIDPLTIDQTRFMATSLAPQQDPFLARLTAKPKARSVILFGGSKPLVMGEAPGAIDLQVVHPVLPDRAGRPGWLFTSGSKAVKAPANLAPKERDILLQAFGKDDAKDAVPLDQLVWRKGAPAPTLVFAPGPVRYVAQPMPDTVCPGAQLMELPGD